MNRKKFFDQFKKFFDPTLNQSQVDGLNFLLDSFENNARWGDKRHIAYALATTYHETAGSMQPVEEGYYIGSQKAVKAFQKTLRYFPYYGRGYVQLTWLKNYKKATKKLGVDFVNNPELVMKTDNAFRIMTEGMFEGWFTGKKLSDFIKDSKCDYLNARTIINGHDKAGLIKGYAEIFERILNSGDDLNSATEVSAMTDPPNSEVPPSSPDKLVETTTVETTDGTTTAVTTAPSNMVAVEKEAPPKGFWADIKAKVMGWWATIGGTAAMRQYQDDIASFGIPVTLIKYAVFVVLGGFLIWLLSHALIHLWTQYIAPRLLTMALVKANANLSDTTTVSAIAPERLAELEAQGYTIVRRK